MRLGKVQKGSRPLRGKYRVVFPYFLTIDQKPISPVVSLFGMSVLNKLAPLTKGGKIDPVRYKTKLCQYWLTSGVCPFEGRCIFSHGQDEIRTRPDYYELDHITHDPYQMETGMVAADSSGRTPPGRAHITTRGTVPLPP